MIYTSREVYEYISKKIGDPIIEWKTCAVSGTQFPVFQSDLDFYFKVSPTISGSLFLIPPPTLCPEERSRRRLARRNERKLYKRKCDATGETIVSIYSPDKPYKVYNQQFWWSDQRDPMLYGVDFDFSKTFTENFNNLMQAVPRPALQIIDCENSDYTNYCYYSKNCFFLFGAPYNEDCLFGSQVASSSDCIDITLSENNHHCYECIGCSGSTNLFYSISCKNCSFSYGLNNCEGCGYCIGCSNIQNKKYWIYNQESTKEAYDDLLATMQQQGGMGYVLSKLECGLKMINSQDCVGNEIYNSKNCVLVFDMFSCANCKYMLSELDGVDSMDCYGASKSPLTLECVSVLAGHRNVSNILSLTSQNIYYSHFTENSSNLFGCIGLRNKSYCIFNKQYTQDEYEKIIRKLIEHMQDTGERGEFFHPSLSPFGYNETVAQEYYPEKAPSYQHPAPSTAVGAGSKLVAGSRQLGAFGYKRSTYSADPKIPDGAKTIKPQEYTQEEWKVLRDTPDITKQIIICEISGRPFLLQKAEIEFYQKHNLPIPTKHPDIRHEERMKLRPGRTLHLRNCDKCGKEMLSIVASKKYLVTSKDDIDDTSSSLLDTSYSVYCETCYKQEVYG